MLLYWSSLRHDLLLSQSHVAVSFTYLLPSLLQVTLGWGWPVVRQVKLRKLPVVTMTPEEVTDTVGASGIRLVTCRGNKHNM